MEIKKASQAVWFFPPAKKERPCNSGYRDALFSLGGLDQVIRVLSQTAGVDYEKDGAWITQGGCK
jgi:hypothetical protein